MARWWQRRFCILLTSSSMALLCGVLLSRPSVGAAAKDPAANPKTPEDATAMGTAVEQVNLGTRDMLERLKLLRVQMALDREEISALELRIKKLQLQRDFDALVAARGGAPSKAGPRVAREADLGSEILVKAISLKPRKEAIIMYHGRVYNVRPGDTVSGLKIIDISEAGLQIGRSGGAKATALVR